MDLNLIKELEISSPDVKMKGKLRLNGNSFSLYKIDDNGNSIPSKLSVADKVNMATILMPYLEGYKLPENIDKDIEVEVYGKLKYDSDSDTYFFADGDSSYPINMEDLNKMSLMIMLDNSLLSKNEYVEEIMNYIENAKRELEGTMRVDFSDLVPADDMFTEWFIVYFKLCDSIRDCMFDGLFNDFIEDIRKLVYEKFEDNYPGYRGCMYDDFLMRSALYSIFYDPSDQFHHTLEKPFSSAYSIQLSNSKLGDRIPSSGKSKDMAAELISNLNYILYRYYNDGDLAENLITECNCQTAINVFTYLDKLNNYDKAIFTTFYRIAREKINNNFNVYNPNTNNWDKIIDSRDIKFKQPGGRCPSDREYKEYYGKVLNKTLDTNARCEDLFSSDEVEFMLPASVDALLAIFMILEIYPDWLKDEKVVDLRSGYYLSNKSSRYDW